MDGTDTRASGSEGFVRALRERAVVLDGGLSNELEAA
ncbi:homocysteine S-methyltransferase, partial [Streptomyces sp. SID11233]|nr:homocysteine S-methyltransferase [Streptomyces sp. SID11233]